MKAYRRLMKLNCGDLIVWEISGGIICVKYNNCYIKGEGVLIDEYGRGLTFEESCENYMDRIAGKTLVFENYGTRKEVTVL